MAADHAERLPFREWLVKQLTLSRWAPAANNMAPADLAAQLGVTESVLVEAIARREAATLKRGRAPKKLGRYAAGRTDYELVRLVLPLAVLVDMDEYLRVLRISKGALFRSLIHRFLSAPTPPSVMSEVWFYRGERRKIDKTIATSYMRTRITRGAQVALDHYAQTLGVPPNAILRGLVIDFLEGRTRQIQIVGFRELWGDPERYIHPEKFRDARAG